MSILLPKARPSILSNTKDRISLSGESDRKGLIEELSQTEDPLNAIYYKEVKLIIQLTLDRLPEQRRKIFEMSRFENMSNNEIAEKLNISVRTVEHHIYLTLLEMKKYLFVFFSFP